MCKSLRSRIRISFVVFYSLRKGSEGGGQEVKEDDTELYFSFFTSILCLFMSTYSSEGLAVFSFYIVLLAIFQSRLVVLCRHVK